MANLQHNASAEVAHNGLRLDALSAEVGRLLEKHLPASWRPVFEDQTVSEIINNGDGKLWVEYNDGRWKLVDSDEGDASVSQFINTLAHLAGSELSRQKLDLEARMPDAFFGGARVKAWLPPLTTRPALIVRKFPKRRFTLSDLVANESLSQEEAERLRDLVRMGANILVIGSTSSGKTTLLNALLSELGSLAPNNRIITIEDTRELQTSNPNALALETHPGYDHAELIKGSLRSRPDRIIVGEVRDGACFDLLNAWCTGHSGMGTFHAWDAEEALVRLEDLNMSTGKGRCEATICMGLDVICTMQRQYAGDGVARRRLVQLVALGHQFAQKGETLAERYDLRNLLEDQSSRRQHLAEMLKGVDRSDPGQQRPANCLINLTTAP